VLLTVPVAVLGAVVVPVCAVAEPAVATGIAAGTVSVGVANIVALVLKWAMTTEAIVLQVFASDVSGFCIVGPSTIPWSARSASYSSLASPVPAPTPAATVTVPASNGMAHPGTMKTFVAGIPAIPEGPIRTALAGVDGTLCPPK
jgi:hypothetical protein